MSVHQKINTSAIIPGPAPSWTPEYIEFWGEVYDLNLLVLRGLRFDVFLTNPRRELRRIIARDQLRVIELEHSLYPKFIRDMGCLIYDREQLERNIDQMVEAAVRTVEQRWEVRCMQGLTCRNGTWFQRMSRKFWPRRNKNH